MGSTVRARTRRIVRLSLMLAALAGGSPAAASYYRITDLGVVAGFEASEAVGINGNGRVVGTLSAGMMTRAMSGGAGGVNDLGTIQNGGNSRASAISGSGVVVGWAEVVGSNGRVAARAFRSGGAGGMVDLGVTLYNRNAPGARTVDATYATGVNGTGRVVGYAASGPWFQRAFITDGHDNLIDLGTLPGGSYSRAHGINDSSAVVGTASDALGRARAFVMTDALTGGTMQTFDLLPFGSQSQGMAISNSGQIAGYADMMGSIRAVRSIAGTSRLQDLGTLAYGGQTYGLGINDAGDVVGRADLPGGSSRAILFSDEFGRFMDLNTLAIDPTGGWLLTSATGINNKGQIVGTGLFRGQSRGFLLTPMDLPTVPAPPGATLAGLGGLAMLGYAGLRRRRGPEPAPPVRP